VRAGWSKVGAYTWSFRACPIWVIKNFEWKMKRGAPRYLAAPITVVPTDSSIRGGFDRLVEAMIYVEAGYASGAWSG